ncbi:MAG: hypothetical protein A2X67_01395 [Ignavibacteria bacterium GWA2_55_11]|nr:MAG: hypothetical protein A2X67_01395 [Ignavibacteria bacterium GWA2_55_11]OGU47767.1 MAG: hypothetical protein A2X68_11000 [Ignavibacteria bacterium GWC2_56_12]OGU68307.1 MAG: hypothetical protein A3C56_10705 [Ignavibacteria bacterium RIFCSPHIGHO2_02_FULL_56_12]OGU72202.1 MAG: hypothetical protein A3H45_04955 [Ignavibacteria bacterium RIFCSPLOWO2_02_FULL_55_14]OGU72286.1 MAG: hypothetical protein A3G43_09755 [Ignavibacteria bacterium RIFCSPLOWO2_12_FULL_56_21]HAV22134.1 hypothetical protei
MPRSITLILILLTGTLSVSGQWKLEEPGHPAVMHSLQMQVNPFPDRKSVTLAIVASLVLPGLGEYYAGTFSSTGKYSFTAEGAIWLTYAGFRRHGTWVRNDARSYAIEHAGTVMDGKDEKFEVDIGNYSSLDEYNRAKISRREPELMYSDLSYRWQWDTDASRMYFRDQRIRSDEILNNSKFLIAAAVVNRLISAFSAGRAAAAYNRALRPSFSWEAQIVPQWDPTGREGLALQVSTSW